MLKSQITDRSRSTRKIDFSSGEVIFQNTRHWLAPSTLAASSSSAGIVFSPASTETAMNGNACQTTSTAITTYAWKAPVVVQLYCAQLLLPTSQCGSFDSTQSTTPPSGLTSQ